VRSLSPRGLKISVSNVLLKGLYHLDGQLRPRGLRSLDSSVKGLIRARHMLLRSRTSDIMLLHTRWSREHNGRGSMGCQRGDICHH